MKYRREQRLEIGRRIYHDEISRYQATQEYNICADTARQYMRLYRDANGLPAKAQLRSRKKKLRENESGKN